MIRIIRAAALAAAGALAITATTAAPRIARAAVPFAEPLVSITFDDAAASSYAVAAPLLAERGLRATYYLLTGAMGQPGFMTVEQARELAARGHEIGSHTVTHPLLPALSDAQLADELSRSQDFLVANVGVPDVKSFAAPFGQVDLRVQGAVWPLYTSSRIVDGFGNFRDTSHARLGAYALDASTPPAFVKLLVDRTIAERAWLILVLHNVAPGPTTDAAYGVDDLVAILDDLAPRVKVLPVGEVVPLMTPPPPGPVLGGVTPRTVRGPGVRVRLHGAFMRPGRIEVGGVPAAVVEVAPDHVDVLAPAHAAGEVDVVVRNDDGQSARLRAAVRYAR
jgi:peptidoglycan/xylan/chitin deacetylase (PgdA/CDA1 family)